MWLQIKKTLVLWEKLMEMTLTRYRGLLQSTHGNVLSAWRHIPRPASEHGLFFKFKDCTNSGIWPFSSSSRTAQILEVAFFQVQGQHKYWDIAIFQVQRQRKFWTWPIVGWLDPCLTVYPFQINVDIITNPLNWSGLSPELYWLEIRTLALLRTEPDLFLGQ